MATAAEISGRSFSRSSEGEGTVDSAVRKFRVLRATPSEYIDILQVCGIGIGDEHPQNPGIYCTQFSAESEGSSRLSVICTFTYGTQPDTSGGGGGSKGHGSQSRPPELRPANWSVSTTTFERPVRAWWTVPEGVYDWAQTPAGDFYDGVTYQYPITTVDVTCFGINPATHYTSVGKINSTTFRIGTLLTAEKHSLLFAGLRSEPSVESFQGSQWRGFKNTYEFRYDPELWYIKVPLSGLNAIAFDPQDAGPDDDVYGQPLQHKDRRIDANPLALPPQILPGQRVRAMVKVFSYEDGGTSQAPSAQPIPLNENGRPRSSSVLVKSKRVHAEFDFNSFNIIFE